MSVSHSILPDPPISVGEPVEYLPFPTAVQSESWQGRGPIASNVIFLRPPRLISVQPRHSPWSAPLLTLAAVAWTGCIALLIALAFRA